jgi:hypothetical protein
VLRTALSVFALALLAPTPALAQESPSPSPMKPACGSANFSVDRSVITAGEIVTVTVSRDTNAQDQSLPVTLERVSPEPRAIVRSDSSTAAIVEWPLRLGESHRFFTEYPATGENCHPLGRPNGSSLEVDVRPVVTIAATRTAPRDYTFSGRVLPARSQRITLWRVEADGHRVLTARGLVRPDGTYGIARRFTGSGRFGFQVDVAATSANLWGQSNVRPTVIH